MAKMFSRRKRNEKKEVEEVLVISYGEIANSWRRECEGEAIKKYWYGKVVECESADLEKTLDGLSKHQAVSVHLVGHHCTSEEKAGRRVAPLCEALSALAVSATKTELTSAKMRAPARSVAQLVEILSKHGSLNMVFLNASHTSKIAARLGSPAAFGWDSACVEEGAVLLAGLFYQFLADQSPKAAFATATRRLSSKSSRRPNFALVDPSDPDAIQRAMPGRLLEHKCSGLTVVGIDRPDGAFVRTRDERDAEDARYQQQQQQQLPHHQQPTALSQQQQYYQNHRGFSSRSNSARSSTSEGSGLSSFDSFEYKRPRASSASDVTHSSFLASFQVPLVVDPSKNHRQFSENDAGRYYAEDSKYAEDEDDDCGGDLSPTNSLLESLAVMIDQESFQWSPETDLPIGVPYSNSIFHTPHTMELPVGEPYSNNTNYFTPKDVVPKLHPFEMPPPESCPANYKMMKPAMMPPHPYVFNHRAPPEASTMPPRARSKTSSSRNARPSASGASQLTELQGIGEKKAEKLQKQGIHTIEALASVDVNDIELAKACTGNKRYDEAIDTLTRWRHAARAHIATRTTTVH